jgi:flavin reductase (DIM6/NTAB) family NADH-FMN oxidoreductase RutF
MFMFSVGSWDVSGNAKDSLVNIQEKSSFTIGIANQHQVKHVQQSAISLDHGVSEITQFGISVTSWQWPTPLIDGCRINFACTLSKEVKIEESSQILIFAKISKIWVADEAVSKDEKDRIVIDPEKVDPLLRLGGGKYGTLGSVMPMPQV